MSLSRLPALLACVCLPLTVHAYDPGDLTLGLHLGVADIDHADASGRAPELEMLSVGYHFNRALAVEARIGSGLQLLTDDDKTGVDTIFALFGRAQFPTETPLGAYLLAGVARTDYDVAAQELSDSSEAFGGGLAIRPEEYYEITFEALRFLNSDAADVTAYSSSFRFYY